MRRGRYSMPKFSLILRPLTSENVCSYLNFVSRECIGIPSQVLYVSQEPLCKSNNVTIGVWFCSYWCKIKFLCKRHAIKSFASPSLGKHFLFSNVTMRKSLPFHNLYLKWENRFVTCNPVINYSCSLFSKRVPCITLSQFRFFPLPNAVIVNACRDLSFNNLTGKIPDTFSSLRDNLNYLWDYCWYIYLFKVLLWLSPTALDVFNAFLLGIYHTNW